MIIPRTNAIFLWLLHILPLTESLRHFSPHFTQGNWRSTSNFSKRDDSATSRTRAEQILLEKGHHMCRKVTAALQREMSRGLTSSAGLDFTSTSAPVIVYSLEKHLLDVGTRKKLAFKCAACIALCFCLQRVTFRVRYGASGMPLSVCVLLSHHVCAVIC